MAHNIKTICLPLPFRLGTVNCYLVSAGAGHVLIDTGGMNNRTALERALSEAGCASGRLNLVILTHGDFDHIANAAYLCAKLGARTAMHRDEAAMAERGDMFLGRKGANRVIRKVSPIIFGLGKQDRFTPDILVDDGFDLSPYGLDAGIVHIPGHTRGSIGVLTGDGDLFCGDLLANTARPVLNSLIDDLDAARASVRKLAALGTKVVYPGHGNSFAMDALQV